MCEVSYLLLPLTLRLTTCLPMVAAWHAVTVQASQCGHIQLLLMMQAWELEADHHVCYFGWREVLGVFWWLPGEVLDGREHAVLPCVSSDQSSICVRYDKPCRL